MTSSIQKWTWSRFFKLAIISSVLVVLLFETIPRWFDLPGLTLEELDPSKIKRVEARRVQPHPYISYALQPNWATDPERKEQASHNRLGFRGPELAIPKPKGLYRVLCLGGSSTYGSGPNKDEKTYPARLQHHLSKATGAQVEVVNLGVKGWTSTESLINLCLRGVELEPDLVLVYHATNDALAALWPQPNWDQTHFRRVWNEPARGDIEKLLEHSWTYLVARAYLTDYLAEHLALNSYTIVNARADYTEPDFDREIPKRGVKTFARNLKQITVVSRSYGAKVIFVRQGFHPGQGQSDSPHGGFVRKRAIDMLLAAQNQVAAELSVPIINAAAYLETRATKLLAEKGQQNVFTGNVHLTNLGADFLGHVIAQALLGRGLIDLD